MIDSESSQFSDENQSVLSDVFFTSSSKARKSSTELAANLVIKNKLSTNKAAVVCQSLSNSGVSIPTPSQSAVWKRVIKEGKAEKIKEFLSSSDEKFALHFDGKKENHTEYQVVLLSNPTRDFKLSVLSLPNGRSETIANAITNVLNDFQAWQFIFLMICDTTSVNSGLKNGVVVRLIREFVKRNLAGPSYIGCQHHILDRCLRIVMDNELTENKTSPKISYDFINELVTNYEALKEKYQSQESFCSNLTNLGWRDDFKFLFELVEAFKQKSLTGKNPVIHWRALPATSNARWNSRAILALLAYFLLPIYQDTLTSIWHFISFSWSKFWFSDQKFNHESKRDLLETLKDHPKAKQTVQSHWSNKASIIDVPRTNRAAERCIKLMEDLPKNCRKEHYLNVKFVSLNDI